MLCVCSLACMIPPVWLVAVAGFQTIRGLRGSSTGGGGLNYSCMHHHTHPHPPPPHASSQTTWCWLTCLLGAVLLFCPMVCKCCVVFRSWRKIERSPAIYSTRRYASPALMLRCMVCKTWRCCCNVCMLTLCGPVELAVAGLHHASFFRVYRALLIADVSRSNSGSIGACHSLCACRQAHCCVNPHTLYLIQRM